MRSLLALIALLCFVAVPAEAQVPEADLHEAIRSAEADPSAATLLGASNATRMMGDYEAAQAHLDEAWTELGALLDGFIIAGIHLELTSGGGVLGAQRAFREMRDWFAIPPIGIANISNNFPELLATGEFDELILKMSPDATDPAYRCNCYGAIAWVHELAGRDEEAETAWSQLADVQLSNLDESVATDGAANMRGQIARNLARAGRVAEAREHLEAAMGMQVSAAGVPLVHRRWAQAYAELGDAESAVEYLEPLFAMNNNINAHSVDARVSWRRIRHEPVFQAMLDRNR